MSNRGQNTGSAEQKRKRFHLGRVAGWALTGFLVLLLLVVVGASWYTTTEDFQKRVGKEVISVLEDATGGRVELHQISFNLWHLAIEANGLIIHGLEGPSEAPYLAADRILIRVKIMTFLEHSTGAGGGGMLD